MVARDDAVASGAEQPRSRGRRHSQPLLRADKGSRASAGANAHPTGNPDRPARRQAHRTSATASSPIWRGGRASLLSARPRRLTTLIVTSVETRSHGAASSSLQPTPAADPVAAVSPAAARPTTRWGERAGRSDPDESASRKMPTSAEHRPRPPVRL
jgi:hypothetical protein